NELAIATAANGAEDASIAAADEGAHGHAGGEDGRDAAGFDLGAAVGSRYHQLADAAQNVRHQAVDQPAAGGAAARHRRGAAGLYRRPARRSSRLDNELAIATANGAEDAAHRGAVVAAVVVDGAAAVDRGCARRPADLDVLLAAAVDFRTAV